LTPSADETCLKENVNRKKAWSVYILHCENGSLYTGIAKNVEARFTAHRSGKGAAYTRANKPVKLVYQEGPLSLSKALKREAAIKKLPRSEKERLLL
jgi:putative endonuclease